MAGNQGLRDDSTTAPRRPTPPPSRAEEVTTTLTNNTNETNAATRNSTRLLFRRPNRITFQEHLDYNFNERQQPTDNDEDENESSQQQASNSKRKRGNNILLKTASSTSEDENGNNANGEMRPNKKLFPVRSEHEEVIRQVRSVLNKVSSVNYTRLRKRWLNLMPKSSFEEQSEEDDGQPRLCLDQVGEVLRMVIAKALDDTIYMHIYAGLMGYVVARKPPEISKSIRGLINSQLHHELKKLSTDKELALFHRSTQLVDVTRRKKVTLHRFIAELYCEKACTSKFLYERVTDLIIVNNPVDIDENVECLCVLMTFAGEKLESSRKNWVEDIFLKLTQRQNETPQMVSKRIQFMILDLIEMRSSGWSPHGKWWSASVQRAPDRERTLSSPSPSSSSLPASSSTQHHHEEPARHSRRQEIKPRSRTRSEGSGTLTNENSNNGESGASRATSKSTIKNSHVAVQEAVATVSLKTTTTTTQQLKQQSEEKDLTPQQTRALTSLLNKVSPDTVDRVADQFFQVLSQDTIEKSKVASFFVQKILDESYYTRAHASLIFRVSSAPHMKDFGFEIGCQVMRVLQKRPESKEGFQLLAELYKWDLVTVQQVRTALDWLMDCSNDMISLAMESLFVFLLISGTRLEADINDEVWMNGLIGFWEKKANLVAHNQGRPLCLLQDLQELRQNKWTPVRQPHWVPPTIGLPTLRFEAKSLIRLFQSDRTEFLRFVKGETSSLSRIENFSTEALEYAVRYGNCERDPEFLKMTGVCLRFLIEEHLLRKEKLRNFAGMFVSQISEMERINGNARKNWGLIMREVF